MEIVSLEQDVIVSVVEDVVCVDLATVGPQGPRGSQILSGPIDPSPIIGIIGDQYINTTTGKLFGPKTTSGWGSGITLGMGLDISDVSYTHYQLVSSNEWVITHPLLFNPNIIVVDLDGKVIEGDYEYNGQTIIANFSSSISGAAYLS